MSIPIEHEGEGIGWPYEQCCFCRASTPMWTVLHNREEGQQVACCEVCSATHEPDQVPTKAAWIEFDAALNQPTTMECR